jgi:hypothetical protein
VVEERLIDDTEYNKALGQYRLKLNSVLDPLRMYGQGQYVDQATEELVSLGVQLHMRLCGVDIPYEVREIHW